MAICFFWWVLGSKRAGGSAGKPGSAKAAAEAGKTTQDQAAAAQTGAADVTPADGKAPSLDASRHNTQGKGLRHTLFAATVIFCCHHQL